MIVLRRCELTRNVRLCLSKQSHLICTVSSKKHRNDSAILQKRQFSLQSTVESFGRTQTGVFKSISESAPVEYLQNFLITVHDSTGLPWWATIVCSTILLRSCVTVPFAVYQQYILAKVENLNLEMPAIAKELQKETSIAVKLYNWDERTAKIQYKRSLKRQWNKLIIRDNCHPFKAGLLLFFQIPMWISFSVSLRNLVYALPIGDFDAHMRLAELTVGGFGWIPNLVEVDSSYILPVALGVINLAIIELQVLSKVRVSSRFQRYTTNFFRGLSLCMVPLAACVPSCLALYWTTSSVYGLVQNVALMSPKVKRACRIPQTASELEKPYAHVIAGLKHRISGITILKIKS